MTLRNAHLPHTTRRHRSALAGPLALLLLAAAAGAQMHKVEKPGKVTRAIGVYEWTGDLSKPTAMRLVPVSLFINGHFEDAGAYLARPVPWVLDTGNEFFIERAGEHEGTLDLDYARNVQKRSSADDNPIGAWYGYGRFKLPSAAPPPKALKPAASVTPIEGSDDDSRPHMSRRTPPAVPAASSGSGSGSKDSSGSGSPPAADPDRPTLGRRDPATPATTSSSSSSDDYDPDKPTLRHRDDDSGKKPKKNNKPQAYVSGPSDPLNDDPDRPHLGRGKAAEDTGPAALTGLPTQLHQAVAVSDPGNSPAHVFTRQWESQSERAETLTALQGQARTRVMAYLAANKLMPGVLPPAPAPGASVSAGTTTATTAGSASDTDTGSNYRPMLRTKASADAANAAAAKSAPATPAAKPIPAKPAANPAATPATRPGTRSSRTKKPAPKPPALTFTGEQLSSYELSYGGLPTFLYTAEVPTAEGTTVYVTLVEQKLPSGEYQVALASVTDAQHLNRVPWMRPVDVVDPDDEHRASLLMELRAQNSRQFALYRLTGPQAEQIFVTGVIE